jgi:hypothetical protein
MPRGEKGQLICTDCGFLATVQDALWSGRIGFSLLRCSGDVGRVVPLLALGSVASRAERPAGTKKRESGILMMVEDRSAEATTSEGCNPLSQQ